MPVEGHELRCSRTALQVTLDEYLEARVDLFEDPLVFLGTWRDGEDDEKGNRPNYVLDLSRPVTGLFPSLELGMKNSQKAVFHPSSGTVLAVPRREQIGWIESQLADLGHIDLV